MIFPTIIDFLLFLSSQYFFILALCCCHYSWLNILLRILFFSRKPLTFLILILYICLLYSDMLISVTTACMSLIHWFWFISLLLKYVKICSGLVSVFYSIPFTRQKDTNSSYPYCIREFWNYLVELITYIYIIEMP